MPWTRPCQEMWASVLSCAYPHDVSIRMPLLCMMALIEHEQLYHFHLEKAVVQIVEEYLGSHDNNLRVQWRASKWDKPVHLEKHFKESWEPQMSWTWLIMTSNINQYSMPWSYNRTNIKLQKAKSPHIWQSALATTRSSTNNHPPSIPRTFQPSNWCSPQPP